MSERKRGAPIGNKNAGKAKIWEQALHRHMAQRPKDLEEAALALFEAAKQGDVSALKEIGDRLDGKVKTVVAGDEEQPLFHKILLEVVDPQG